MKRQAPNKLTPLRARIDEIDDAILALLAERAEIAITVGRAKKKNGAIILHDPERERSVLERVSSRGAGRFPKSAIRNVFREVMSACLSLEEALHVSYLGPAGTFSQMAAQKAFGLSATYVECATIEGVLDAVLRGAASYAVVPIENSQEGGVAAAVDGLIDAGLFIRDEIVIDVAQCLLSHATSLARVTRVFSHAQALGQCRGFLAKNLPHAVLVQSTSTAQAVEDALSDPRAAAIGSALAGELTDVPVLRANIQDQRGNATRFFVLGTSDAPRTGDDKTTLVFSVRDGKGALRRVLSVFEDNGVNLSRIESRPSRKTPWHYVFFVDLEGHRTDADVARALVEARPACQFLRVLGSYPRFVAAPERSRKRTRRR